MVVPVLFEHYVMVGKKRYEPSESEWFTGSDNELVIKSNFSTIDIAGPKLVSVLATPWRDFRQDMEILAYDPERNDDLWISHRLYSNTEDPADWWK